MKESENDHFATTVAVMDSGKESPEILKPFGESLLSSRIFT